MLSILGISFILLLLIGFPFAFAIGISTFLALLYEPSLPMIIIPQRMFVQIDSFPLMAIPFFILAGEIMEKGGISHRLVRFADSIVGHVHGGLGMAAITSSMIFAGMSGSSAADASATGSITIPAMIRNGYPKGFAASIESVASSVGPIIPPSSLMIIYAAITGVSTGKMFLGGIIPGVLIGLCAMVVTYFYAKRLQLAGTARHGIFNTVKLIAVSAKEALWALMTPIIIIGGIITGIFTATEAGVVAVVYSWLISLWVYKTITIKDTRAILLSAVNTTSMVTLIVAFAAILGWLLSYAEFPQTVSAFMIQLSDDPRVILGIIICFLLLVGTLVEVVAAAIILIPVLFPLGDLFQFNEIHYAVIIVITLAMGCITPPVGILIFITTGIAKTNIVETSKFIWPYLIIVFAMIFICAVWPETVTFIPDLFWQQ
jgi:C4-dicarboxylate transporter DctM subunit